MRSQNQNFPKQLHYVTELYFSINESLISLAFQVLQYDNTSVRLTISTNSLLIDYSLKP